MKKCFFKVYKNLHIYKLMEFKNLSLKIFFTHKKKLVKKMNIKNYSKTFCFEIGVKRSVYTFFNLSRWAIKKYLSKAEICGLKKISW